MSLPAELIEPFVSREDANGLVNAVLNNGLAGLRGLFSDVSGVNRGFTAFSQSSILYRSSGTGLNSRTFAHGSFDVSPAVLLDLRLRCLSDTESGFNSSMRVGSELPALRCCNDRISHELKADSGC